MKKIIRVRNLEKKFTTKVNTGKLLRDIFSPKVKSITAVNSINFEIKAGESVAFLGPNGAGKTTTIKMLTGLMYPTSGSIEILGFTPFDREREFLMQIGLVMGGKAGMNFDLTPRQSLDLLKQIYNISDKDFQERVYALTNMLDTKKILDIQVRRLSLGERMKMELISSILHNPKILFLDEPTIGLDIVSKNKIRNFLRSIQKAFGTTMLLTSHDMDDIRKICDRVIIITEGKLVYDNYLSLLTNKYKSTRYLKFIFNKMPDPEKVEKIDYATITGIGKSNIYFKVKHSLLSRLITEISNDYDIADIDITPIPLDEIIENVFQKNQH
ncbi:ATP-binding cassette domain-containing protein [Candidatus Dojkabacteria bacterium]|nr:ATP-binding cassette domain-containing protein [Candidatus Dojkabacteria bacterium]